MQLSQDYEALFHWNLLIFLFYSVLYSDFFICAHSIWYSRRNFPFRHFFTTERKIVFLKDKGLLWSRCVLLLMSIKSLSLILLSNHYYYCFLIFLFYFVVYRNDCYAQLPLSLLMPDQASHNVISHNLSSYPLIVALFRLEQVVLEFLELRYIALYYLRDILLVSNFKPYARTFVPV